MLLFCLYATHAVLAAEPLPVGDAARDTPVWAQGWIVGPCAADADCVLSDVALCASCGPGCKAAPHAVRRGRESSGQSACGCALPEPNFAREEPACPKVPALESFRATCRAKRCEASPAARSKRQKKR